MCVCVCVCVCGFIFSLIEYTSLNLESHTGEWEREGAHFGVWGREEGVRGGGEPVVFRWLSLGVCNYRTQQAEVRSPRGRADSQ